MSSFVNYSYVGMTSGINLPNSVIVQGGVDGAFFPANQIGWGKSLFAGVEFGDTQGLLNAIETAIGTGGTSAVQELKDYLVSEGYITESVLNTKLEEYASKQFVADANTALEAALKAWVAEQKYALASDVTAHTGDAVVHITADERTAWNAAKESIDAFLNDNAVSEGVVDTLKEIQEYITSDGSAANKMTQDIAANKKAIDDEVAAREGAVTTLEGQIADAESAAKAYADGLASNYDAAGAAATAEQNAKDYTDSKAEEINNVIAENEEVVATALTDLNTKTDDIITSYTSADNELAARIKTISDDFLTAADKTEIVNAYTAADEVLEGKIADAEAAAKSYADGLASNYDAAGAAATAEQNAKNYADSLASNYDAAGAAATAEQNAKDYTDSKVEEINNVIAENEEIVATALTDLNTKTDDIITSYTSANDALAARIKTIEDAPYATESYVSSTITTEIAKVVAEAPEDFDTLKEIADWIANDVTGAADLANKVTANENAIKAISDDYLTSADKTEIVNAYTAADEDVKAWVTASYTTSVNPNANSITVNGTKITFSFANNVMSINQYIATALNSVSLSPISATKTNAGGGNQYIGTSYELTAGIDVTTTEQTLTIDVANTTLNNYKLAVHDGTSYIINDTEYRTTNGSITQDVSNYIMGDVANTSVTGTTTWGSNTHSVNTEGEKTFSVWVTEEGQTTLAEKTVSQSQINASVTVTGMAPVMKGTDGTDTTCTTKVVDLVYGEVDGEINLGTHTFAAGEIPTIAVPTCAGKTLKGYSAEGSFQDTSWAIVSTAEYTLNGCTTEYAIWCITEDPNAGVLVPKANAGESTLLIKLS